MAGRTKISINSFVHLSNHKVGISFQKIFTKSKAKVIFLIKIITFNFWKLERIIKSFYRIIRLRFWIFRFHSFRSLHITWCDDSSFWFGGFLIFRHLQFGLKIWEKSYKLPWNTIFGALNFYSEVVCCLNGRFERIFEENGSENFNGRIFYGTLKIFWVWKSWILDEVFLCLAPSYRIHLN